MSTIGKIGLSILLFTAIAGAALWILGGKQVEYSTAQTIDAPPEAVFPFLTKPEQIKSWTTGLSEVSELMPIQKIDGVPSGPIQKTMRVVSMPDGSRVRYEDRVIRYEENQTISVQSSSSQQVLISIYQLEPRDGQTFLTYRLKTTSCGTGRLLAPLSSSDFQNRIDGDILKLKALVESTPRPPTPLAPLGTTPMETDPVPPPVNSGEIPDVSNAAQRDAETPVTGQPFSF